MNQVNDNAPFLLIQKPQELIKLFEGLIDRKLKDFALQILNANPPLKPDEFLLLPACFADTV